MLRKRSPTRDYQELE
nr:unnamed protein product [Callosobruchus analis]